MPAMICESPSFHPVHEWTFLTFGLQNPQYRIEGGHWFSSILRLITSDCDQYYAIATTAILFYDYFLTLADEVSHFTGVSLCQACRPSRKRSNTLSMGRNHGVCGKNSLYSIC